MGSFECSCKKGYKLLINERNCQGKGRRGPLHPALPRDIPPSCPPALLSPPTAAAGAAPAPLLIPLCFPLDREHPSGD